MRTGTVKFWHEKGYAWIIDDETKKDIYTFKKLLHPDNTRLFDGKRVDVVTSKFFQLKQMYFAHVTCFGVKLF